MTNQIVIKEVAPRDGLQAQPQHLTLEQRQRLIESLAVTGVPELEIAIFAPAAPKQTKSPVLTFSFATDDPDRRSALRCTV